MWTRYLFGGHELCLGKWPAPAVVSKLVALLAQMETDLGVRFAFTLLTAHAPSERQQRDLLVRWCAAMDDPDRHGIYFAIFLQHVAQVGSLTPALLLARARHALDHRAGARAWPPGSDRAGARTARETGAADLPGLDALCLNVQRLFFELEEGSFLRQTVATWKGEDRHTALREFWSTVFARGTAPDLVQCLVERVTADFSAAEQEQLAADLAQLVGQGQRVLSEPACASLGNFVVQWVGPQYLAGQRAPLMLVGRQPILHAEPDPLMVLLQAAATALPRVALAGMLDVLVIDPVTFLAALISLDAPAASEEGESPATSATSATATTAAPSLITIAKLSAAWCDTLRPHLGMEARLRVYGTLVACADEVADPQRRAVLRQVALLGLAPRTAAEKAAFKDVAAQLDASGSGRPQTDAPRAPHRKAGTPGDSKRIEVHRLTSAPADHEELRVLAPAVADFRSPLFAIKRFAARAGLACTPWSVPDLCSHPSFAATLGVASPRALTERVREQRELLDADGVADVARLLAILCEGDVARFIEAFAPLFTDFIGAGPAARVPAWLTLSQGVPLLVAIGQRLESFGEPLRRACMDALLPALFETLGVNQKDRRWMRKQFVGQ